MEKLIYSYSKDKNIELSPLIKVGELYSNVNGKVMTDEIITYRELTDKTTLLAYALGADKLIITSAYRDKATDIAVGGTGKGMHVEGKALDVIFYKNNKVIDTKLVSCKAQDIGFGGIARISNTATHLDIRSGKKYYGDETKGYNTVTTDFYKYYKIDRNDKDIEKVCKKFNLSNEFWQKNYYTDLGKQNILELFAKISKGL